MKRFIQGAPPNTGDTYLVTLKDGRQTYVFFCPQQGWIDREWNTYNEDSFLNHAWESQ